VKREIRGEIADWQPVAIKFRILPLLEGFPQGEGE
jgi:hypothetical protein